MINAKRVIIATIFGFITGIACFLLYFYGQKDVQVDFNKAMFLSILLNRALIGFVIGISAFRIHWALHGLLIGLLVGLPYSIGVFIGGADWIVFFNVLVSSIIWGFIIELFTSVVFKAKVKSA